MNNEYWKLNKNVHQDLNSNVFLVRDRSENKNQDGQGRYHLKSNKKYPEENECFCYKEKGY